MIFGENVTRIPNVAFSGSNNLTNITIPNSVDTIGYQAFFGCTNITSITLKGGHTWVDNGAFVNLTNLATITCHDSEPPTLYSINVFGGTTPVNNIEVIVPCFAADTYRAAPIWNTFSNFSEQLFHTLIVRSADNTRGGVSILVRPDCENLQAQFQANAYNGFLFHHWSDGNTDNPRYLVLTQDTVLEAIFLAEGEEGISDLASADITVSTIGRTVALAGTNGQMLSIYDVTGRVIVREKAVEGKPTPCPTLACIWCRWAATKPKKSWSASTTSL